MVDRGKVKSILERIADLLEKCGGEDGKPGPCPRNKPESSGSDKPAGRQGGLINSAPKLGPSKSDSRPGGKQVRQAIVNITKGKVDPKEVGKSISTYAVSAKKRAEASISRVEKIAAKLKNRAEVLKKVGELKKYASAILKRLTQRISNVAKLLDRMKEDASLLPPEPKNDSTSKEPPKKKPPKKDFEKATNVKKDLASEMEGVLEEGDKLHQIADRADELVGGQDAASDS